MNATNKAKGWLLPAVLILFLLEIILFPFATQLTYAGRSEGPHHVLTYTTNKLTWDSATGVDPITGVAQLSLFSSSYQNVQGENGEKVVAPGTQGKNIVRLKNDANNSITYTAVMYREKEEDTLPVEPALAENALFTAASTYPLPQGVTQEQVVQAVTGSLQAGQMQDFDITWFWNYYESDERDKMDTALGNKAAWYEPDDVMVGLYITVTEETTTTPEGPEDPGTPTDRPDSNTPEPPAASYIRPIVPQTGDTANIGLYLLLIAVSGVLLLLITLEQRKKKQ